MRSEWSSISLLFLFCVAVIGTSLRAIHFVELPLQYPFLVHAHSHVAFHGWVYTLIMLLTTGLFLSKQQVAKGLYGLQFKITVFVIVGILVSFALQGYGLYSIIFSSLFQLLNYWFIFRFFKDSNSFESKAPPIISIRLVKTGFWLGLLSTLAPWAIGVLSARGLSGTEAYHSLVYFYLHFQYNGWFLFVVLGLLFRFLEHQEIRFDVKDANYFYWSLTLAVVPAYTLSLLGMSFRDSLMLPAIFSATLQLFGLFFLWKMLRLVLVKWFSQSDILLRIFTLTALISFFLKVILQAISIIPVMETYAFGSKNLILAYLHLSLIGVISFFLIAFMLRLQWLSRQWPTFVGSTFLIIGFMATEIILVLSGFNWWYPHTLLFVFSGLMAVGILLLLFGTFSLKEISDSRTINL